MKQPAEYYDKDYFEGNPAQHKSNYTVYGGYTATQMGRNYTSLAERVVRPFRTPPGSTVLEVGCAYGYLVQMLRRMGYDAYGMDISEFALSQADPEVRPYLIRADVSDWIPHHPLTMERWHLITSMDVLEHAESKEEAQRILYRLAEHCDHQVHFVTTIDSPFFHSDPSHGVAIRLEDWLAIAPPRCVIMETPL